MKDILSKFNFSLPDEVCDDNSDQKLDEDGDLVVKRLQCKAIEIGDFSFLSSSKYFNYFFFFLMSTHNKFLKKEHKISTALNFVGYQIWRGALLLADFIIYNRKLFGDKTILEVGSGVGLTSIVAAKYSKEVICTGNLSFFFLFFFYSVKKHVFISVTT